MDEFVRHDSVGGPLRRTGTHTIVRGGNGVATNIVQTILGGPHRRVAPEMTLRNDTILWGVGLAGTAAALFTGVSGVDDEEGIDRQIGSTVKLGGGRRAI